METKEMDSHVIDNGTELQENACVEHKNAGMEYAVHPSQSTQQPYCTLIA